MKTTITFLFGIVSLLSFGQSNYLQANQEWLVKTDCAPYYPCVEKSTSIYYFGSDSTVGSYTYTKVYKSGTTHFFWSSTTPPGPGICTGNNSYDFLYTIIRQDGYKLYTNDGGNDQLLYDFDLQIGDFLPVTLNQSATDLEVTSIGNIDVNGDQRQVFYINNETDLFLIEGIGHSNGLFELIGISVNCASNLDCYQLNGTPFYSGPASSCNFNLKVNENAILEANIYPNPGSNQLTIDLPASKSNIAIYCYQMDGKLVQHAVFAEKSSIQFNHHLHPGQYIIKVEADSELSSALYVVN